VEGVPPELAVDIEDMLVRLGLPPDASFEDLVWAVRQQQDTLGDLDAAVLFLDEWRKLYSPKKQ
jgi:spore maturation protein CgeB